MLTKQLSARLAILSIFYFQSIAHSQPHCSNLFNIETSIQSESVSKIFENLNPRQKSILETHVQQQLIEHLFSILKISPTEMLNNKSVRPDQILDLSQVPTTRLEHEILYIFTKHYENGTLHNYLNQILSRALNLAATHKDFENKVSSLTEEKKQFAILALFDVIKSTLHLRGVTSQSTNRYEEWTEYSKKLSEFVASIKGKNTVDRLVKASESEIVKADEVRVLVNGTESFPLREKIIDEAKDSIDVMSWAIYDDLTGHEAVNLLIKKHNEGVKVRVVVDHQVSQRPGYGAEVSRLEHAGISVIRWKNPSKPFEGQHRKMMIIDSDHVIAGGLNFGDVYSHKNIKSAKWRDTDIYLKGSGAAVESQNLFNKIWNSQVDIQKLILNKSNLKINLKDSNNGKKVLIIDSRPGQHLGGSPILKSMLIAIQEAKNTINIENAYVILFPAIRNELVNAAKRGIKVRVFTNSAQSVDEPIVSLPILRSAKDLAENGIEVYLKKGDTLHSKLLEVDGYISMIMSYNLHPRSERVEQEVAVLVIDEAFGKEVASVFDNDLLTLSTQVGDRNKIEMPNDVNSLLSLRIFFDQL